jgi:hypothetical protein
MKIELARFVAGLVFVALGAIACRQSDPGLEPKTPPNSPVPTKLDRPDDSPSPAPKLPKLDSDAGSSK